jgi:phosphoribosylanthranilate isomerase
MKGMKVKVCGMRDPENIAAIANAGADMLGFIFFEKSKRYVNEIDTAHFNNMQNRPEKVGVFVNAKIDYVLAQIADFQLNYVQLHGDESSEYCAAIKEKTNVEIIKAFSVDEDFGFQKTKDYINVADYFLFDTKGKERGGNGVKFNWDILQKYQGEIPFLLSGGISLEDVEAVKLFRHPQLWGVDINSGFESAAGIKKVIEVKQFIVETTHRGV